VCKREVERETVSEGNREIGGREREGKRKKE
jgi:hypothetical protein